jgi:hypothetical protein
MALKWALRQAIVLIFPPVSTLTRSVTSFASLSHALQPSLLARADEVIE